MSKFNNKDKEKNNYFLLILSDSYKFWFLTFFYANFLQKIVMFERFVEIIVHFPKFQI